jgi:LAO/AO transport system kinase
MTGLSPAPECSCAGADADTNPPGPAPSFLSVLPAGTASPVAPAPARPLARLSVDDYVNGVRRGDRGILARAITLIESSSPEHQVRAQKVLQKLLPFTGRARRLGITGVPGVGKSTLIETLGCYLCDQGLPVAVLAVDPTSTRSGGSILGDKTRMEQLCRRPNAFIRPSPSGRTLGGVARKTRETMLLCEAAGFEVLIVETVGVGQSEVTVRSMVDFFLLLILPGAGDELQGIKKGIVEQADALLITKADGENRLRAEQARQEYAMALHYLPPNTPGWTTPVSLSSAVTGEGIPEFWQTLLRFYGEFEPSGRIAARRSEQAIQWLHDLVQEALTARFHAHPQVRQTQPELEAALLRGELTAPQAARALLELAGHEPKTAAGATPAG